MRRLPLLITALLASTAAPAIAQQEGPAQAPDPRTAGDDFHTDPVYGEILVSAIGVEQLDVLAGSSVVQADELLRNQSGQLGEVLAKLPGVSASSFSPGASRPILRGFQGERVKVLIDGIGAIDVSNTSVDHATTIDPLTAERIEVLRGPAVLLFGSQAIGGAVNVIDKRIPQRNIDEPFHLDVQAALDTASDRREAGASLDLPLGDSFVVHVDGTWRETDDLEIGGFTVAPALRAELLEEALEEEAEGEFDEADELREAAEQQGILPNSATETWSANAGIAFFDGDSNLGVAVGWYDTRYGVPGRPGAGHHHGEGEEGEEEAGEEEEEERVTIDLRQFRADLRGTLDLGDGFFRELRTRAGYSDYTHTEFEGSEVGTVFEVQGIEARAELVQNNTNGWGGSVGVQYYFRDFDAEGAEAYVPKNRTNQIALFALQEVAAGPVQVEFAGRYEMTDVESQPANFDRSFDTFSGAVGLAHETEGGFRVGATASHVERAPSAEELLSDGPHIATQAFEIGDRNLSVESAWGVEAFARGRLGFVDMRLAVFQNWFSDYIYLVDTGLEEDDLPVFQYLQDDADYFGVEAEITFPIIDSGPFSLIGDLRGDYIRAELSDGTALPRIPPLSLLGALEARTAPVDARVEVQWADGQDRTASFETQTEGYTLVNASVAWRPVTDRNITVLFQADNIFDVTARRHASFTKDFVPLSGRNLKVSARLSF